MRKCPLGIDNPGRDDVKMRSISGEQSPMAAAVLLSVFDETSTHHSDTEGSFSVTPSRLMSLVFVMWWWCVCETESVRERGRQRERERGVIVHPKKA